MFWIIKHLNTDDPGEYGTPNCIRLIGPFETEKLAASWAERHNPHDNPWWHVGRLGADPLSAVVVVSTELVAAP